MMGPFRCISGTGSHVTISWSVQLVVTETLIGGLLGTAWKSHGQQYTSVHITTSILVEWGVQYRIIVAFSYKPFNSLYTKIFVQLWFILLDERSKNVSTIIYTYLLGMQSAVHAHRPITVPIHTLTSVLLLIVRRSYITSFSIKSKTYHPLGSCL